MVISYNQICISEYIVKTLEQDYNSFSSYFDTTKKSHNDMNIEFTIEVCVSLYY
jgi:hypothetical protein